MVAAAMSSAGVKRREELEDAEGEEDETEADPQEADAVAVEQALKEAEALVEDGDHSGGSRRGDVGAGLVEGELWDRGESPWV